MIMTDVDNVTNPFSLMEFDARLLVVLTLALKDVNNVSILWKSLIRVYAQLLTVKEWKEKHVLYVNQDSSLLEMDLVKCKILNVWFMALLIAKNV